MASPKPTASPFAKVVVSAMRKLYPEKLADSSFDNTGLLLEAPYRAGLNSSVLLTIDLTKGVADEAIKNKHSVVVAYHPIIFRGLKSLTLANTQQSSLLRLAQEGITVYSPHTAVDAAPGGLNDWLADVVTGDAAAIASPNVKRTVITPVSNPPEGFEEAGYGRIVRFGTPETLGDIFDRIVTNLGIDPAVSVATPQDIPRNESRSIKITSVGICAGSGGSMLNNLDVDLLFTGELSHHEALAAVEQGKCVITAFHSNTERGFLKKVMRDRLRQQISKEIPSELRSEMESFDVEISTADRDPYQIAVQGQGGW